ncbi:hypothetical protein B0H19DRAFT_1073644 [Mycena capillaripes]|nr:hypothetical protein B0H19DRAFT_1073644 [Mycena capillaripes]
MNTRLRCDHGGACYGPGVDLRVIAAHHPTSFSFTFKLGQVWYHRRTPSFPTLISRRRSPDAVPVLSLPLGIDFDVFGGYRTRCTAGTIQERADVAGAEYLEARGCPQKLGYPLLCTSACPLFDLISELAAHPNVPILLLEDIEFLVDWVVCNAEADGSVVELAFNSEDAYAATFAVWSSLSQFMLVTSHPSCNPSDERGAWLVSSVAGDSAEFNIILQVRTVPVREMGSSFRLSHVASGVSTAWGSPDSLFRRDIDDVFQLDKTFDFAPPSGKPPPFS